jgi:pyruvate/2-oxoglutarate dehydrogenase complex dihydrolipoamide dehydrogenase (E3) component
VAHVGLYEKDLQERNIAFATFTREFAEVDRGIVDGETEGFVRFTSKRAQTKSWVRRLSAAMPAI